MTQVATTKREVAVMDSFQLDAIKDQVNNLLSGNPQELEKFKTKMVALALTDGLAKCTPESIIACGVQALTLKLPLAAGQGYVVAYKQVAQLDIGYKGWQMLAKRDNLSVLADPVFDCDHYISTGYNFDLKIDFEPNLKERQRANDDWVKKHLQRVIVSIRDDTTGLVVTKVVERDMLDKIIGMSPSANAGFSPHNNWTDQMMCAKAIKQVISKMPIDIDSASKLNDAIRIVNETESAAQKRTTAPVGREPYLQEKFDANWPAWVKLVETEKKRAVTIINQLSNGYKLDEAQTLKLNELYRHEPLTGDVSDADLVAEG